MGVRLVATNDSHFLREEDHEAHAALVAIQTGKTLDDPNRMCYPGGVYFKSAKEMYELFSDVPQALETTLEIAGTPQEIVVPRVELQEVVLVELGE